MAQQENPGHQPYRQAYGQQGNGAPSGYSGGPPPPAAAYGSTPAYPGYQGSPQPGFQGSGYAGGQYGGPYAGGYAGGPYVGGYAGGPYAGMPPPYPPASPAYAGAPAGGYPYAQQTPVYGKAASTCAPTAYAYWDVQAARNACFHHCFATSRERM